MWILPSDGLIVATNTTVMRNGRLIMGGGQARDAAIMFPDLPRVFGNWHNRSEDPIGWRDPTSNKVLISVPTKRDPGKDSIIELIENGASKLPALADQFRLTNILLPTLGTGLGNLNWKEVEPVLSKHLDDRFTVVFYQRG